MKGFKVGLSTTGERIVLRSVLRGDTQLWLPVVAIEDLPALFDAFHSSEGLGFVAADKLFTTVRNKQQQYLVLLSAALRQRC